MTHQYIIQINGREIGEGRPAYIIAEMSANHGQDFNRAIEIIRAAKKSGADAIKLQTYTPDTITLNCDGDCFQIKDTLWRGRNLYSLYRESYMPWEWQPRLKAIADDLGLDLFSTPFDHTAVSFLEEMAVPAYKVASFEVVDIPLIQKIARTGKPIILSTGMATLVEIDEAVKSIRAMGGDQIALLKCTSSYPAPPEEMNLRTIRHLSETFHVPAGLSDHTLGIAVPIASVALGASIIEKHFTLSRSDKSPDSSFSIEPDEFRQMVESVRIAEKAMGEVSYDLTEKQKENIPFRRSLFVVQNMKAGDVFTEENVHSIRPGYGLPPKFLADILGRRASRDIAVGTPLNWGLVL